MTTLYIAQLHQPESKDRDNFDTIFIKTSREELIAYIKDWVISTSDLEEEAEVLRQAETLYEIKNWFDNHFAFFSFNYYTEELS